ncbi:chemotaxis protein CheW [Candidimonas sp. SYP-B2681]|uniref:chemotaxis protein CheW n=1 Tax=Candidimonas sp. SYP-B2681 TaxID=2497686 RepID=UPI0018F29FD3|nr:chemotaxis protein CheW [Candidimonas sp. SYP-B2681]
MLFLLFQLDNDRYALPATQVAEVLPLIELKHIPNAPAWVAGVFSYQGAPVPVIDLSMLALGRAAQRRLSTRTVLVHYPHSGVQGHLLGLVVERATETLQCDPDTFVAYGVDNNDARYLGPVLADPRGLIQWIKVTDLLPKPVQALLFPVQEAI